MKSFIAACRERAASFFTLLLCVPLAFAGYLVICFVGFFGQTARARAGVRALDHFVNAAVFGGYAWESLSSHAWREREKWWAKVVIWFTDQFQPGHTQKANKREQHVVDLILRKGLHDAGTAKGMRYEEPGDAVAPTDPELKAKTVTRMTDQARKALAERLLTDQGEIKLCWAASGPASNGYANLGDGLSAFMIANLAGLPVRHTAIQDDTTKLIGVGSIGHSAKRGHAVIWGTGCYRPDLLAENVRETTYDVLTVRGNISQHCLESAGIKAPPCYGEPVWLLPSMFHEEVEKKYELGIINHISDLVTSSPEAELKPEWSSFQIPEEWKSRIVAINTWHTADLAGMLDKLRLIRSCKRIASRSFHGVVIAETYGIPCLPLCSNPGVPPGAFASDQVKLALLDKRTREFFNHGQRRPNHFYGQRRNRATDWDNLISSIDRLWSPIGYDATPMLESFPFEIPIDPIKNLVPIHPSLSKQVF